MKITIISQLKLEPILLKLLFHIRKKICYCKMCNYNKKSNKTIKSKTLATAILKILLHAGCTIINIAAQLAYCNIEFFSSFRITPDNFPANKKDRPYFSFET